MTEVEVRGTNLIGYSDSALGGHTFQAVNPKSGALLPLIFIQATPEEIHKAAELAHAVRKSGWSDAVLQRADFLEALADEVNNHSDQLIQWYCLESALPEARAKAELQRSCFQMRSYAEAVRSGYALGIKITTAAGTIPDLRKMQVPIGPVAVFGASNFPFAYSVLGGDVASAIAAGCPVIVKGHPMHPHTGELSARIIRSVAQKMNLPEGLFSFLHAEQYTVGEQLVSHPMLAAVGFTGSIQGGTALQRLANNRKVPIPVFAEMGSTNPIVVTAKAAGENGKSIAAEIVASFSLNAGQFCTSPGLLFVTESAGAQLLEAEIDQQLTDSEPQVMLHPRIFEQYVQQLEQQLPDAQVLVNGLRKDTKITPTVLKVTGEQFLRQLHRREEVFGSFVQLVICKNEDELEACLESLPGQLTGSLYCGAEENPVSLIRLLEQFAGRIIVNGVPTGVAVTTAMQHGGPFPSSSMPATSAVGADAILRFSRPVSFQNTPDALLPMPLKRENPLRFLRFVNGFYTDNAC